MILLVRRNGKTRRIWCGLGPSWDLFLARGSDVSRLPQWCQVHARGWEIRQVRIDDRKPLCHKRNSKSCRLLHPSKPIFSHPDLSTKYSTKIQRWTPRISRTGSYAGVLTCTSSSPSQNLWTAFHAPNHSIMQFSRLNAHHFGSMVHAAQWDIGRRLRLSLRLIPVSAYAQLAIKCTC